MVSVGFHFHHDGAVFEGVGAGPFGGFADGQWGGGCWCVLYIILVLSPIIQSAEGVSE